MGEHPQVVGKLCMLSDDDPQPLILELGPPSPPKDLLDVQHTYTRNKRRLCVFLKDLTTALDTQCCEKYMGSPVVVQDVHLTLWHT